MPCKHAVAVFQALNEQCGVPTPLWDRLDASWFSPVWRTSTWRLQYERPFVAVKVCCVQAMLDAAEYLCAPLILCGLYFCAMCFLRADIEPEEERALIGAAAATAAERTGKEAATRGTCGAPTEGAKLQQVRTVGALPFDVPGFRHDASNGARELQLRGRQGLLSLGTHLRLSQIARRMHAAARSDGQ